MFFSDKFSKFIIWRISNWETKFYASSHYDVHKLIKIKKNFCRDLFNYISYKILINLVKSEYTMNIYIRVLFTNDKYNLYNFFLKKGIKTFFKAKLHAQ